jgi:acetyl-CoA acetyltransferase
MGITAENVAKRFEISREDQDQFAREPPQGRRGAGRGRFDDEIVAREGRALRG